ncbi:hypothetical protein KEM44_20955 [Sinorhizobium meliloti]|uniref:hypothetical protein n=1 Tax=Rhizobium meliloti TaxID=382 RepID=UPI000B5A715E|nr:hypothetical protein [Sinorhizobium meliloti]ASJ58957.1 hypothetical protein SMB554_06995 [Sinorhizobium meliloti]MCK3783514.1 hypothetical protein [Sinorhizobium meliloti]MCK3787856.1 hypothetical protein [Sinorhizobium meliloti]MCK3794867.1 hypothetical protein [Sinorhizobium meliloti]UTG98600.1 hypothetical protein KEM44_20955 [Sinorhizobium meliloti]
MSEKKIDDGGQAYPLIEWRTPNGMVASNVQSGMSLRDWFAGQAMQGICAHPDNWGTTPAKMGVTAYDIADAMIAAKKAGA